MSTRILTELSAAMLTTATLLMACATASAPSELAEARAAYQQASHGLAVELAPVELQSAHLALAQAELTYADEGGSCDAVAQARLALYVAERADAVARERQAERQASRAATADALRAEEPAVLAPTSARRTQGQPPRFLAERHDDFGAALTALAREVTIEERDRAIVIVLDDGLFAPGSAEISGLHAPLFERVAEALRAAPEGLITIVGYTDSAGPEGDDPSLARNRADSVRSWLLEFGVPRARLVVTSGGEADPEANHTPRAGREQQRRVEIAVEVP